MASWIRGAALVYVTYWTAAMTLDALWSGRSTWSAEHLVRDALVPAVQAALLDRLLAAIRRSGRTPRPSRLSVFFLVWAVLTLALIVTTLSISLAVFRSVDMTVVAIFSLVAVPALQACVLIEPIPGRRQWIGRWTAGMAHPLARPILWIDLILLTTGVVLLQNPQVGLAWAPMQR